MQPLCPRGTLWRKQTRFPPLGNRFTRLRTRDFQFTLLLRGCKIAPPFPPPPLRILLRRAEYVSVHTCQRGRGGGRDKERATAAVVQQSGKIDPRSNGVGQVNRIAATTFYPFESGAMQSVDSDYPFRMQPTMVGS